MDVHLTGRTGTALMLPGKSDGLDSLRIEVVAMDVPRPGPGQVLVEIRAAGVNPSDVKASLGQMPQAVWPRIPGRDFAGVVAEGPAQMVGMKVWGGGGELGITQNGSHARWMVLDQKAVRAKPENLTMEEAGSIGVPFVTAYEGLREAGGAQPTDTILVCGANGKVGQATIQLATMAGARVFAVNRSDAPLLAHCNGPVELFDQSRQDVAALIMEKTEGRGVDIVFNTVGSPYFKLGNDVLAKDGRQIFISTLDRAVPFDIFRFFRGRHRYIGIDSLGMNAVEVGRVLERLRPRFETGQLRPFPVREANIRGFHNAREAYASVLSGISERIVLRP